MTFASSMPCSRRARAQAPAIQKQRSKGWESKAMAKLKRTPRKSVRNSHLRKHPAQRRTGKPVAPEFLSLQEIVLAAKRNLTPDLWNHLAGGSDSETTLK